MTLAKLIALESQFLRELLQEACRGFPGPWRFDEADDLVENALALGLVRAFV